MKAAILSSTSDLRLELNRISDECIAGGPLLSLYTLDSRNSFVSETGDLYLSGSIVNPTSSPISFDPAKIKVAFSSSGSPYAGEVTKLDGTKLSAMTIPANDYLDLIIKMPTNWDAYMNVTSDGYSYLDLYIRYTEGSVSTLFSGSYCVTKGKAKLSMVVNMTEARRKAVKARIAQYDKETVFTVLKKVAASPFHLGCNDRNWKCDFDWIFKAGNFTKILEGNYDEKRNNNTAGGRKESVSRLKGLAEAILTDSET